MSLAKDLFNNQGSSETSNVMGALSKLIGEGEQMDMVSLVKSMAGNSELGAIAASWLGDGENLPISSEQVQSLFESEKLSGFASALGIDTDSALQTITQALPKLIDSSSEHGALLSMDSPEDIINIAKKFFS
jgi:uncharacterized protein YidB (DUF937 family)